MYSRRTSTQLDFFSECGGWQCLKLGTLPSPHPTTQSLERIHFQLHSPVGNELLLTKRLELCQVDKRLANQMTSSDQSYWADLTAHHQVKNKLTLCKYKLQNQSEQVACTKITCSTWTGKYLLPQSTNGWKMWKVHAHGTIGNVDIDRPRLEDATPNHPTLPTGPAAAAPATPLQMKRDLSCVCDIEGESMIWVYLILFICSWKNWYQFLSSIEYSLVSQSTKGLLPLNV